MDVVEVLKWIGIVLAAGFVGYFGRYLAVIVIEKMRKKPAGPVISPPGEAGGDTSPEPADAAARSEAKLAKKLAKEAAKQAKKENKG